MLKQIAIALKVLILAAFAYTPAEAVSILEAKSLPDGATVSLSGKIATISYGVIPSIIYIEEPDASAGIQVDIGSTSYPDVTEGKVLTVKGAIFTRPDGERAIDSTSVTITGTGAVPEPVPVRNRTIGGTKTGLQQGVRNGLGPNNIGLLVKTWGWVASVDHVNDWFDVDDGSGIRIRVDTSFLANKPSPGDYVWVTGLVSTYTEDSDLRPLLVPRKQKDVAPFNPLFETQSTKAVPPGKVSIHWLGQGGWLLRDSVGNRIAVDPYLSNYKSSSGEGYARLMPAPIPPEQLNPGLTLLTHRHGDHTDPLTLKAVKNNSQSVFWGPPLVVSRLTSSEIGVPSTRVKTISRGQKLFWNGIPVTAMYANHPDNDAVDAVGYLIEMAGKKIYISGDTLYDQTLVNAVKAVQPDVIMVCINGRNENMNASEAASLVKACGPRLAVPMHYGMFSNNTIDPQNFIDACSSQGVTSEVVVFGTYGYRIL